VRDWLRKIRAESVELFSPEFLSNPAFAIAPPAAVRLGRFHWNIGHLLQAPVEIKARHKRTPLPPLTTRMPAEDYNAVRSRASGG
jgi:hypothetical protein